MKHMVMENITRQMVQFIRVIGLETLKKGKDVKHGLTIHHIMAIILPVKNMEMVYSPGLISHNMKVILLKTRLRVMVF